MSERPEPVMRPNGKVWRGRRPIRVATFTNHDEGECLVVLGTHDIEEATRLAQNSWTWNEGELFYAEPIQTWWRLVPWDATGQGFDSTWIVDKERGTPCVVFDPLEQGRLG